MDTDHKETKEMSSGLEEQKQLTQLIKEKFSLKNIKEVQGSRINIFKP